MCGLFSLALLKCWGFAPLFHASLWCMVLRKFPEGLFVHNINFTSPFGDYDYIVYICLLSFYLGFMQSVKYHCVGLRSKTMQNTGLTE